MILRDIFIGNFPITQKFGENFKLASGKWAYANGHMGVDFGTPKGTKLVSPTNGEVIRVGDYKDGYGFQVQVWDKEQGIAWRMGHLMASTLKIGQKVWVGKLVGLSDNTGFSTGNHLHFEVCRVDKNCRKVGGQISGNVNPLPYFRAVNLKTPVVEDPMLVAQRKAVEQAAIKAKSEADALAKALEAARLAKEAELKRQEAERLKAEEKPATKIPDVSTLPTEPPVHAENLDINKVVTLMDLIQRTFKLIEDFITKLGR